MPTSDEPLLQSIEQTDVLIVREMPRFFGYNEDFVFPHTILTLILSGSARAMYDMRVITHHKNDQTIIRSGHIMHPLDCTEDFTYALLFISPKMLDDLRFHTFSHDHKKFDYAPVCSLTDEQAAHLLTIVDQLVVIANHTDKELPHRYQTLLAQLAVGYEFLNYYRRDQDRQWAENRHTDTSGNSLYAWLHRTHILLPIFQERQQGSDQQSNTATAPHHHGRWAKALTTLLNGNRQKIDRHNEEGTEKPLKIGRFLDY